MPTCEGSLHLASITGFGSNVSGATGTTNVLEAKSNYRVYILPRGADAASSTSSTKIEFDSVGGSSRFVANQWVQVGLSGANVRQVTAAGGASILVNTAITVTAGDHVFAIGMTQPSISGSSATYQPLTTIFTRSDDAGTPATDSLLTTDANGLFRFFAGANLYDAIIQDSNVTNVGYLLDVPVGISTDNTGTFGQTLSVFAGLTVSGRATIGQTTVITGGVSVGQDMRVYYDLVNKADGTNYSCLRVGRRAQTTGDNRTLGYFSELFDQPITDANERGETVAVYGINLLTNSVAAGCEAFALQGDIQYNPETAVTNAAGIFAVQGGARFAGTHPSSVLAVAEGGHFQVRTGTGSTGTVQQAHGVAIVQPINSGTVAFSQYIGLYVQGASAGFAPASQNQVANFSSGDDNNHFLLRGSPFRWDDSFNNNAPSPGRVFDIAKTIQGASALTTAYYPIHLNADLRGTFTAGDDVFGYRSLVRTNTASGDGTNLDQIVGYQADVAHRSNIIVDELYGFQAAMTNSGTGVATTMAGLNVAAPTISAGGVSHSYGAILNSTTPASTLNSAGHIRFVPVSLATPATTLATLAAEQEGTLIFVTDSNNADNSGLYLYMGGGWYSWTPGGVAAASDT